MRKGRGAFPVEFEARFSFFAVLGFLVCTDRDGVSLMCAGACLLHELGHLAVMLIEKRPPDGIVLYGGGIHIRGGSTSFPAAAAGVAVNTALFLLCGLIPWESRDIRLFGVVNLLIAAFNLLPFGELDGKLMLDRSLTTAFTPQTAVRVSEICERLVPAILVPAVIVLAFTGFLNFSAVIFLIYVLAVEIPEKI